MCVCVLGCGYVGVFVCVSVFAGVWMCLWGC